MEKINDGSGKLTDSYNKIERWNPEVIREISGYYNRILQLLGEDPGREGLLKTPERVAKALSFLTRGYEQDPEEILRSAIFKEEYRQMVIVKDIDIYSMCEHHMLPFFGKAHVAYIPDGYITGLSKIARVVETYAARLQVQERLTTQVRNCIQDNLKPPGGSCGNRGAAYVHADTRCSEAKLRHYHICLHRMFSFKPEHPRGIYTPHRKQAPLKVMQFLHIYLQSMKAFIFPGQGSQFPGMGKDLY